MGHLSRLRVQTNNATERKVSRTMQRHNVAVVFGGRSPEHEVSIITAQQVCAALEETHNVIPIYVTKSGEWLTGEKLRELSTFTDGQLPHASDFETVTVEFGTVPKFTVLPKQKTRWFRRAKPITLSVDVVFPAIHGSHGEDGTLQGLLELMNLPYVGAGVVGSAVGMDKIMMKAVLTENQIPIVPYLSWTMYQWDKFRPNILKQLKTTLGYPVFVKPALSGSSIGVSRATNNTELLSAVQLAGQYCRRILVEQAVKKPAEINCAVMGTHQLTPSVCEQPMTEAAFLTFEDKYLHENEGMPSDNTVEASHPVETGAQSKDSSSASPASSGMAGATRKIPAPISEELTLHIQELALQSFQALDCTGIARIDFLMDESGQVYVNEINTLPGSFSFYLWEHDGVEFPQLVSKLIDLAFAVHQDKNSLTYSYPTNLLSHAGARLTKLKKGEGKL